MAADPRIAESDQHSVLVRITAPHFVAGVILNAGKVIRTAPIIKYMLGWDLLRVANYCRKKGWKV